MTRPTIPEPLLLVIIQLSLSISFLDSGIHLVVDMSATVLDELHGGASAELRFKLMGYFCAGDESINYGEKMAGYVSKGLDRGLWGSRDPSMPSWVVRPDKTALGVAHIESGKVLMPVEVSLSGIGVTRFGAHLHATGHVVLEAQRQRSCAGWG